MTENRTRSASGKPGRSGWAARALGVVAGFSMRQIARVAGQAVHKLRTSLRRRNEASSGGQPEPAIRARRPQARSRDAAHRSPTPSPRVAPRRIPAAAGFVTYGWVEYAQLMDRLRARLGVPVAPWSLLRAHRCYLLETMAEPQRSPRSAPLHRCERAMRERYRRRRWIYRVWLRSAERHTEALHLPPRPAPDDRPGRLGLTAAIERRWWPPPLDLPLSA